MSSRLILLENRRFTRIERANVMTKASSRFPAFSSLIMSKESPDIDMIMPDEPLPGRDAEQEPDRGEPEVLRQQETAQFAGFQADHLERRKFPFHFGERQKPEVIEDDHRHDGSRRNQDVDHFHHGFRHGVPSRRQISRALDVVHPGEFLCDLLRRYDGGRAEPVPEAFKMRAGHADTLHGRVAVNAERPAF